MKGGIFNKIWFTNIVLSVNNCDVIPRRDSKMNHIRWKKIFNAALLLLLLSAFIFIGGKQTAQARATYPIQVPAEIEWVSTGIWIYSDSVGLSVNVQTTGTVITGPINWYGSGSRSGPAGQSWICTNVTGAEPEYICALEGYPFGMLVGRVGNTVFPIGDATEIIFPASGYLYLAVNDYLGTYWDNNGEFNLLVQFK